MPARPPRRHRPLGGSGLPAISFLRNEPILRRPTCPPAPPRGPANDKGHGMPCPYTKRGIKLDKYI